MLDEASSPWHREAVLLAPASVVGYEDLIQLRRRIAAALARAYELGHAEGRLAEIDAGRREGGDGR